MPFGEVPGEVALSVITADHLTHAWDLARATGQDIEVDDELAEWALATWQVVVPAEGRPEATGSPPSCPSPTTPPRSIGWSATPAASPKGPPG